MNCIVKPMQNILILTQEISTAIQNKPNNSYVYLTLSSFDTRQFEG